MSPFSKASRKRILAFLCSAPILAACSFNMNQNPIMANVVRSLPLDNGQFLSIGYKLPGADADCQLINETTRNWAVAQSIDGSLKAGGGRQVLEEEAIASVKQRPQDGINYVDFTIPNESYVGVVNVTAARDAKTSYFRCTNPPQPH